MARSWSVRKRMTFIPAMVAAGADAWVRLALSAGTAKGAERRRFRRLKFTFMHALSCTALVS
jgi:hypothetical protein